MMSNFELLIGKTITSVKLDKDLPRKHIIFHTSRGEKFHFKTEEMNEAAKTYINSTSGLSNLIGHRVEMVHDSRYFEYDNKSFINDMGLSLFTANLMTIKGTFTIDYRTIHDGTTDDGYLVISLEDSVINNVLKFEMKKNKI